MNRSSIESLLFFSTADCTVPTGFQRKDVVEEKYEMASEDASEEIIPDFVCTCKKGFRTSLNLKGCDHAPECHLPDNECVEKGKKKIGVKRCVEDIAPVMYNCECLPGFELNATSKQCILTATCKKNDCGSDPRAKCSVLPTGDKSCTCSSTASSKLHYLKKERRCCEEAFVSNINAWIVDRLTGELNYPSRTGFVPLTKMDFAVGHSFCNTFYVTSTGVLACLLLERRHNTDDYLKCYNYLYAHRCLGKPLPEKHQDVTSFCSDLAGVPKSKFCSTPTVFRTAFKLNIKQPQLQEPVLDRKNHQGNLPPIEAIFSPLAMDFYMSKQSSITVRQLFDDYSPQVIDTLRKFGAKIGYDLKFKETFFVHFENMHERGESSSIQDTVSFHIILTTTYKETYIFGLYDDCVTFNPKIHQTRRSARLFLWSHPSRDNKPGLQFGIEADEGSAKGGLLIKAEEKHRQVGLQDITKPGLFGFNLNDRMTQERHYGLRCQEWLDKNPCLDWGCTNEWKTRFWCPRTPESIDQFYAKASMPNLKNDVDCYQPTEEPDELKGYMPICCYNSRKRFIKGPRGGAVTMTDVDVETPVNVVSRGKITSQDGDFAGQTGAYSNCCGDNRYFTPQCTEFRRRRPFTENHHEIIVYSVSIWHADVQIDTLDGASYIFNGAMEVLMAKGQKKNGNGFSMTALLQPGFSAPKVTFATAVAMQCGNSTKHATSDLVQFSLTPNRTKIQIHVNGLLRTNLTVEANQTVELKGATLRTFTTHVNLVLQCGLAVRVTRVLESLSLETILTPGYEGRVTGLLGNNDGNPDNDIRSRDGTQTLSANASEKEIFPIASTWRVNCLDPIEVLLHTGKPCGAFNDLDFRPAFFNLNRARAAHPEGQVLCGNNTACWVDLAGTNSSVHAEQAKKEDVKTKERRQKENNLAPVFEQSVIIGNMKMGSAGSCSIVARDLDSNDTVSLAVTGTPTWMRFDAAQRRLSWAAPPADVASQGLNMIATASDRLGGATTCPVVLQLCACQNGGSCQYPRNGTYTDETSVSFVDLPCRCPRGWAGPHCEKDADGCLGNPCMTDCTDVPAAEEAANATMPPFHCAECPYGFEGDGQMCTDIDECLTVEVAYPFVCTNTYGDRNITCAKGFRMVNGECLDVNECTAGTAECPQNAVCKNVRGNYSCECPPGTTLMGRACVDHDECSETLTRCADRPNTECRNILGGFECACKSSFYYDGIACVAADMCKPSSPCGQICKSSRGGFACSCEEGFKRDADRLTCLPIKNCSQEQLDSCVGGQCASGESDMFFCTCGPGTLRETEGNVTHCRDQDECSNSSLNACVGVATCKNKPNGYDCVCPEGYKVSVNKTSCEEIDECAQSLGPCDVRTSSCRNTPGSFECVCKEGFSKAANKSCEDFDECSEASSPCSDPGAVCKNLVGSFECPCRTGFRNNGSYCIDRCELNSDECIPENHSGHLCSIFAHCSILVFIALFSYYRVL